MAGLLLALSSRTHAAQQPASAALFLGTINHLEDQGDETFLTSTGGSIASTTPITSGDFLLAVFQVESINGKSGGTNALGNSNYNLLTGVSLLEITSVTDTHTQDFVTGTELYNYTFAAPSSSQWLAVTTGAGAPLAGIPNGTILTTYTNPSNTSPVTASSIGAAIQDAAPGNSLLWNFGFTGAKNSFGSFNPNAAAGEGWTFTGPNADATANTEMGIANLIPYGEGPGFQSGLNLISSGTDTRNIKLIPTTDFNGDTGLPGLNQPESQMVVSGRVSTSPGIPSTADAPILGSGTNFYVDPTIVPEPSSLVTLSLSLCAMCSAAVIVRRQRAVVAGQRIVLEALRPGPVIGSP